MKEGRIVFVFLSMLYLAGCEGGTFLTTKGIIAEGWAEPPDPYKPESLYCYRTLSGKDCYRKPLAGQEHRLVGAYEEKEIQACDKSSMPGKEGSSIIEKRLSPDTPSRDQGPLSLKRKSS